MKDDAVRWKSLATMLGHLEANPSMPLPMYSSSGPYTVQSRPYADFMISNTPKPETAPSLCYQNGRLSVEGAAGSCDTWAGRLRYANAHDDRVFLDLADKRGDGTFEIALSPGDAFGFGVGMDTYMFGTFHGVSPEGVVTWVVANGDPEYALDMGYTVREEKPPMRYARQRFQMFDAEGNTFPELPPDQRSIADVRGMINTAMWRQRQEAKKPMHYEHAQISRAGGGWSMAHPHPLELVPVRPDPVQPSYDGGTNIDIEVRHTKGGVDRANVVVRCLRVMAEAARKGTSWPETGKLVERELAEYKLALRVEEHCDAFSVLVHCKLTQHQNLRCRFWLYARTLPQMCRAIDEIREYKFTG